MNQSIAFAGLEISPAVVALGVISGMSYGLLAVGLVLAYRSNKVINFAHGEIGAFGAALAGLLVVRWSIPYWVAVGAALAASAAVGAGTEAAVLRRLRQAPRLMSLVATLGVAAFLVRFSAIINSEAQSGSTFPQPSGLPEFRVGVLLVTQAYSATLFLTPLVVLGIALFLRRSRYGLALRAASANHDRARMCGISPGLMSSISWGLAGAVGAFATIFIIPTRGFITAEALGPVLLLRALAPAVIARMQSLPVALGAGIAIGVVDQVLTFNDPTTGTAELGLLGVIAAALLFQSRGGVRLEDRQKFGALQPWKPASTALKRVWAIRNLGSITFIACATVALLIGVFASNSTAVSLTAVVAFSLIGLSLGVVTGLGGQLSLGQLTLAGVGGTVSFLVTSHYGPGSFVVATIAAALVTGLVALILGLPALRVKGLLLAVLTLSFALAAKRWFLVQEWALGSGVATIRPQFGPVDLTSSRAFYFWALLIFFVGFWLARNIWSGCVGLRLRAVRDNEDAARSFGLSATAVKLHGFALAGVIAGMAGSIYAHLFSWLSAANFDVTTSITCVALAVLGGIGLLAGPVLGAVYMIGLPLFVPLDNAGLAASSLGWLLLILYFPGGLAQLIATPRRWLIHGLARRKGIDPLAEAESDHDDDEAAKAPVAASLVLTSRPLADEGRAIPLLEAEGLVKHFGGVCALDGVDMTLERGEILGLLGPNGAGKTTLFETLSGFVAAEEGRVTLASRDVTGLPPERRARLGLVRSFQDAALFPTLTVLESVTLAFERRDPTNTARSALGLSRPDHRKRLAAAEVVGVMGLQRLAHRQIRELSTGTRRITELACAVALEPRVLLLDEPSSGIAQRESEALGELLLQLRTQLGCTLVIVEHDIPLLMGLATRVMAMDAGRVITVGTPDEVRHHPSVVTSYLGTDEAAIERSRPRSALAVGADDGGAL